MKEFKQEDAWTKFKDYLQKLAKRSDKPFSCPYLAVLPRSIKYESRTYPKGSLICSSKVGWEGPGESVVCGLLETEITFNTQGQIEASCSWDRSKFALSIVSFESQKLPVGSR
jgi:hypothetical protein